ncbi:hypothetical protein F4776DRAFT_63438 [Hypoxylon sp. NC0597]|nr:hypothetical protein F4776DRAFT_63438 [Hypoxylon sp. NC0597]
MDDVAVAEGDHEHPGPPELDWETLSMLIIHGVDIEIEDDGLPLLPEAWTLDEKHAPFPLNLQPTWYCATLLVLILILHTGLDAGWLLHHEYSHYIVRILSRTILTVAISFFSTLLFEVLGRVWSFITELAIDRIFFVLDVWFIELLHWGPVDAEGNAIEIEFHADPRNIRQPIRHAARGIVFATFHYMNIIVLNLGRLDMASWSVFLAGLVSTKFANFILNLPTTLALPTPGLDGTTSFKTLYWEFGVPALLQVWVAAFLYLWSFSCIARSETPRILGQASRNYFYLLKGALLRATAMHLLAYTAYQIVCIGISATHPLGLMMEIPQSMMKGSFLWRLGQMASVEISPRAGILLLGAHWLVKNACRLIVEHVWPLWVPYMVWLSIKTELGTWASWEIYSLVLNEDMDVFHRDKAVRERVLMTILFGLKSSWPARMRLSSVNGIDERGVIP